MNPIRADAPFGIKSAEASKLDFLSGRELTGPLLRAARALLGVSAEDLAGRALLSVATIKRAESKPGPIGLTTSNAERLVETFARADIRFVRHEELGLGVFKAEAPARTNPSAPAG